MQLLVLRRVMVSARARGMPEITNHGKLFFFDKNHWQPVGYRGRGFGAHGSDVFQLVFNRRANNPAQIRAEDRTSGRDRCKPASDDGARILLRQVSRLQCAQTADVGSIVHRM